MTNLQKEKVAWWAKLIPIGITPVLVLTVVFQVGKWNANTEAKFEKIEERIFDTPLEKQEFKRHVQLSRTELENYITKKQTDSILNILKSELSDKEEVRDLAKKNAVQIFQINKAQKETNEKLDRILINN